MLATVAPLVLAWVRLQQFFPQLFQWKCPLQNASGLAISKMKFQTSAARGPFPRVLNLLYSVYTTRGHNAIMKNGLINNEVFTLQGKKCSVTTEQELSMFLVYLTLSPSGTCVLACNSILHVLNLLPPLHAPPHCGPFRKS